MARIPSIAELRTLVVSLRGDNYRALMDAATDVAASCDDRDLRMTAKVILNLAPHSNAA